MAVFEEQRAVARRHPAIRVTGWVILQISLGFDDSAGCHEAVNLANQDFAEQSSGQCNCVRRHRIERNPFDRSFKSARRLAYDGSLRGPFVDSLINLPRFLREAAC
jgi:hypothetical protein